MRKQKVSIDFKLYVALERQHIKNIDTMNGYEFEKYMGDLDKTV